MQPPAGASDRVVAWVFVIVQFALLGVVFLLPPASAWSTPGWLSVGARIVALLGLVVVVLGALSLGRSLTPLPVPMKDGELRSTGLYRYVRHPIYGGVMLLAVGWAIQSGNVVVVAAAVALVMWLAFKARWEERRLTARYPGYSAYAARTPRFIPPWRGHRAD